MSDFMSRMLRTRLSLAEMCREAAEARGVSFAVTHSDEQGGRQLYVVGDKVLTPGAAAEVLGVVWP